MRLDALSGSKGESLAQYESLEEILRTELGTEPAASTRALKEEIAAGRFPPNQAPFPASPLEEMPGASRHNLPAARSSFVGREREMLEVRRELAMTRLLTLTGAGGSGKTRLALEVARNLIGAYREGVWLVELAPLSEGELVAQAVAGTLGTKEQPGRPLVDTLLEELRPKQTLLILDNCEHLVGAVARLVDALLDACPRLRVLTTSREALRIEGEVRWPVPALSAPDPQRHLDVEELKGYDAARFFAERARRRDPSFMLTPQNAQTVAHICRRVEGIALAVELAAVQVGTLSVDQISERLETSIKLLTGGGRTAVPRQRTLSGALDWSHALLSEGEKKLFGRLSVFAGGWTLEAAEAVSLGEGIQEGDILELLSGLVDKSLVVAEPVVEGSVRYRMLEPIRQYALERLHESEEAEEAWRQHASYYLALAQEAEPELRGQQQGIWLDRLETEHDNFRTALSWAIEQEDAELYLRLAGALWKFWDARGYYNEAHHWFEEVLAKDDRTSAAARAKVLEATGWLAYDRGDMDRAGAAAKEGLELLSAEAEIEVGVAAGLRLVLGYVAEMRGDEERATELHEEALALGREAGHTRTVAGAILALGVVSAKLDDHERATELFEEGLVLSRELADAEIVPYYLINLGYEYLLQGDHERAAALNEEAAALYREQGRRGDLQTALDNLGWAALLREDHERAKTFFEESLEISRELGTRLLASESIEGFACLAGARGEAERAARLFAAAQELREAVGYEQPRRARAQREPYLDHTRSLLEEEAWEAAFADGRTLTLEEAVEYALSEKEPATSAPPAPELPAPEEPPAALTRREREVADLLARGLTNRHIATELFISERTVDHHVEKILKKLNLRSREQVASRLDEY